MPIVQNFVIISITTTSMAIEHTNGIRSSTPMKDVKMKFETVLWPTNLDHGHSVVQVGVLDKM